MSDLISNIQKANQDLFNKTKCFAKKLVLDPQAYKELQTSICYTRTSKTQLSESFNGMVIVIKHNLGTPFQLQDFYDPMEEENESSDN